MMFARIVMFLGLVFAFGCQASQQARNPAPQETGISRDRIFAALTGHSWTRGQRAKMPDYFVQRFSPDGTYIIEHQSDYPIAPEKGHWTLEKDAAGDWMVCRENGSRERVTLQDENSILLGTASWQADEPQVVDASHTAATLPKIELPAEVTNKVDLLTSHVWRRANDFD